MTVKCSVFSRPGWKFFFKKECEKDILIGTNGSIAENEKYSISYDRVTITQLSKSDSGRYKCGRRRSSFSPSYVETEVIVVDGESQLAVLFLFPAADS